MRRFAALRRPPAVRPDTAVLGGSLPAALKVPDWNRFQALLQRMRTKERADAPRPAKSTRHRKGGGGAHPCLRGGVSFGHGDASCGEASRSLGSRGEGAGALVRAWGCPCWQRRVRRLAHRANTWPNTGPRKCYGRPRRRAFAPRPWQPGLMPTRKSDCATFEWQKDQRQASWHRGHSGRAEAACGRPEYA